MTQKLLDKDEILSTLQTALKDNTSQAEELVSEARQNAQRREQAFRTQITEKDKQIQTMQVCASGDLMRVRLPLPHIPKRGLAGEVCLHPVLSGYCDPCTSACSHIPKRAPAGEVCLRPVLSGYCEPCPSAV